MAHTAGTSARTQRLIALAATTLLGVVTAMAIGRVFLGAASSYRLMLAAAVSAALACALERKNLLLATAASAAALLVVLGIVIFPATTWHGLPTLETLRAIGEAARVVGQEARFQVAPSPPLPSLMLAALTATWAAVFSSHALAFRAGSPLLALLPPIALVAFADTVLEEFVKPVYGVLFLAAALLVVFADGLRRVQGWGPLWTGPGREARLSVSTGRSARGVAFATLALALIVPLLMPGFGSKAILDFSTHDSDRVHIDPLVSVANRLQRDAPVDIFTVETSSPSYYRYAVLTEFDGAGWFPASGSQTEELPPNPAAAEAHLDLGAIKTSEAQGVAQRFHFLSTLEQSEVPLGAPASALDLGQPASWDPESGTVTIGGSLDEGLDYSATALQITPTQEELRQSPTPTPAQLPQYFQLPDGIDPRVKRIADDVVQNAGATNAFDKAMAIQAYLTSGAFKYDQTVPTRDDSTALLDFLTTDPRGMCQQFATAMAAMLRMEGVPTRVAVGFTQGTRAADDQNLWTVSTDDAHAWAEVLFPGFGWLPFESTPGKINPVSERYLNPGASSAQCDRPTGCEGARAPGGRFATPATDRPGKNPAAVETGRDKGRLGAAPPPVPQADAGRRVTGRTLLLVTIGLVLLLLLLLPVFRILRRRAHLRRASGEPRRLILATYDVFTERAAELGFARGAGETLEEFRTRVHGSGLLRDGDLDRLTRIAVGAAYAAPDPSPEEARSASEAAETTLRDLRKGTPFGRRLRGLYVRER